MYYVAVIVVAAALMEFLLLPLYVRLKKRQKYLPAKMTLKGLMTAMAFGFALYAVIALYNKSGDITNLVTASGMRTSIILPTGLFVCMVADVVLCVNFKVGMLLFLCGHLCYTAYFVYIGGFAPASLAIFAVGVVVMSFYFGRYTKNEGKMFFLYTIYGVVITMTLSTGLVLPFTIKEYGVLPALAAALLVVSDVMLGMNKLKTQRVIADLLYLGYYFTGQFFLALSVFVPTVLGL